MSHDEKTKERRLIPVPDWPEYHPWPPIRGLRHLIFHSKTNGFDRCVFRVGRKLLIDESAFFAWIDSQQKRVNRGGA